MAAVIALAALLAALAAWWAFPGPDEGAGRLRSAGPPADISAASGGRAGDTGRRPGRRTGLLALGAVVAVGVLAGPSVGAITLAGMLVAGTIAVLGERRRMRIARVRGQVAVVQAGEIIAGLLRVGRIPSEALIEASRDAPLLRSAAAEVQAGGEAAPALRRIARAPGLSGLGDLAAAWEVATRTGASLVEAIDAAAAQLAADQEVAQVVAAELAATRLGGRVMAVLPLVGLGLAAALGGDPVAFWTASPPGWLSLNAGVALACAGVLWIDAVASRAGGR